jgi:hypothetical protein
MTIDTDTQTWTITAQLTCNMCSCLPMGRHDAGRGPGRVISASIAQRQ